MPRLSKLQARKRLNEAMTKIAFVYMDGPEDVMKSQDLIALEKILIKCIKRTG